VVGASGNRKGLVTLALTSLVLLGGAELALRVYHRLKLSHELERLPPLPQRCIVPSSDPELMWEFNPGWTDGTFSVNALGMADGEIEVGKPPGVFRIAFAGDSVTANFGLTPRHEIYVEVLERLLDDDPRSPARRVETLNFGVNGYDLLQSARVVTTRIGRFEPDLVVVQLCLNDPHPTEGAGFGPPRPVASRLHRALYRRLSPERFWGYSFVDSQFDAEGIERIRRAFAELGREAARRPPLLAVLFPYLRSEAYARWGFERYHERLRAAAENHGVPFLDLRPAFDEAGLLENNADPLHPNAAGHRLAARVIADELERRGWLAPLVDPRYHVPEEE
jgi:lysophospholipase L1-like esterase